MTVPQLTPEECRVVGCLVEKQLTTPQHYPLTLNALTLACNQATNRDPVVAYGEPVVQAAVMAAKERGLARFVHPAHGRSALRFRHVLDQELGLDARGLALISVLLLRGPQTPGELRARTERMAPFEGVDDVQSELDGLASRPEPLVACLARRPGQKEDRYAHLLGEEALVQAAPLTEVGGGDPDGAIGDKGGAGAHRGLPEAVDGPGSPANQAATSGAVPNGSGLAEEVAHLRRDLDGLRRDLDELRRDLQGLRRDLDA